MNLTDYSRSDIEKFVRDGIAPVEALRDYDALTALAKGEKVKNVAMDSEISRMQVWRIRKKYTR